MLRYEDNKIIMDEYDYGLALPVRLSGDVKADDKFIFIIKKTLYSKSEVLKKEYTGFETDEEGKLYFNLNFTKEDSDLLKEGKYVYFLKQCRKCQVHNTIVREGTFIVEKGCKI